LKIEQKKLPNILWLGGASDAGKTTIAQILATRNRWQLYLCDMHEHNHFVARANPDMQPTIYKNLGKSIDDCWVFTTPEEMFQGILKTNDERFTMVVQDVSSMPSVPTILVEGPRLFPNLVMPYLVDVHQAIWLLPTDEFAEKSATERDKPKIRYKSSNPELCKENFFKREELLRHYIRQEVFASQLHSIDVTGFETLEETAYKIEVHFKTYLSSL